MTQAAPQLLRYTEPVSPPWDDRLFRQRLVDSGVWSKLLPAEAKVLGVAYRLSDARGDADLPLSYLVHATGYGERAVREARHSLEQRGVILHLGKGKYRADRYRLVILPLPGAGVQVASGGEATFRQPGSYVPSDPEAAFPQRDKEKELSSSRDGARTSNQRATLFERPPYDAAAAALLVEQGMSKQVAKGVVGQYRPTAEQVGTIVANIDARNADAQRGLCKPIRNRAGFLRAAIQAGNYEPDERVLEAQRRARAQQATAANRPEAKLAALPAEVADRLREAAAAAYPAVARLPEGPAKALRMQELILEQARKEGLL